MFEREHDEALLDVEDQEEPEMEEDEEDPSEEPEMEVIAISDEEDPSEESETEVIAIPDLPEWALTKESTPGQFNVSLVKQIMSI